jgi:hypothetical protein
LFRCGGGEDTFGLRHQFPLEGFARHARLLPSIDRSRSYTETDFENIWSRPIQEVRRELKLPPEGYMPGDVLPERAPSFDPQPA